MFCKKCGKEIADGLSVCPECNAVTAAAQTGVAEAKAKSKEFIGGYKNFKSLSTTGKILHIAIPVAAVVVVVVIFSLIFSDKYVSIVKNGHLTEFSKTETVGEAFDDFFASPKWKSFKSEKGDRIVEFNGECEYFDERVKVCIQFEVDEDDESFEISYADIDGEDISLIELYAMLEAAYEE